MGLDMYLRASRYTPGWDHNRDEQKERYALLLKAAGLTAEDTGGQSPSGEAILIVGYWRKANQIHRWFVLNVQQGEDECEEHDVSREQLQELLELCRQVKIDHKKAEGLLPPQSGFFFGGTDIDDGYFSDIDHTIEILERVLGPKFADFDFTYRSSW